MKRIIMTSITAVVVVAVLAGTLIPILDDATATTDTFTNEGYFNMTKYDTSTDVTIEWDHSTPTIITVNGTDYTLSTPTNTFVSLVIGDTWYFRYANGVTTFYTQMSYGSIANLAASTVAGTDLEVVCSGGTATGTVYTNGTTTSSQSVSYTELYVISGDSGDYVMKSSGSSAYMAADSEFLGLGTTTLGTAAAICRVTGNIEDGASVDVVATSASSTTLNGTPVVNTTDVDDHDGYSLSTITFVLASDGTDYNVTYSYFVVPATVTLERDVHFTDGENAIFNAIPVMIIIALLLGVVALVLRSRMD